MTGERRDGGDRRSNVNRWSLAPSSRSSAQPRHPQPACGRPGAVVKQHYQTGGKIEQCYAQLSRKQVRRSIARPNEITIHFRNGPRRG
jgi:hypothetical protein